MCVGGGLVLRQPLVRAEDAPDDAGDGCGSGFAVYTAAARSLDSGS